MSSSFEHFDIKLSLFLRFKCKVSSIYDQCGLFFNIMNCDIFLKKKGGTITILDNSRCNVLNNVWIGKGQKLKAQSTFNTLLCISDITKLVAFKLKEIFQLAIGSLLEVFHGQIMWTFYHYVREWHF